MAAHLLTRPGLLPLGKHLAKTRTYLQDIYVRAEFKGLPLQEICSHCLLQLDPNCCNRNALKTSKSLGSYIHRSPKLHYLT